VPLEQRPSTELADVFVAGPGTGGASRIAFGLSTGFI
jgi:hypothetical protein